MTASTSVAPVRSVDRGATIAALRAGRRRRSRRYAVAVAVLTLILLVAFLASLILGQRHYPLGDVLRVIGGQDVPGASYTVGRLRLPRAALAVLAGAAFGLGGVSFQTMLRNPLASPDIIGITSGASAAAVYALVILHLDPSAASVIAIVAALGTALAIYGLAARGGLHGTKLILIGIGVSAMLHSVVSYVIIRAAQWDLQTAMRWLNGSVNGATWSRVLPLAMAMVAIIPILLSRPRALTLLEQGDDTATALGVRTGRTRLLTIVGTVVLLAFATAAAGPIAFVAFLSGPIASRLVGTGRSLMVPAMLVGASLTLLADFAGQFAFGARYPVGVITGVLGAPYLVYLLIRTNRTGGSL